MKLDLKGRFTFSDNITSFKEEIDKIISDINEELLKKNMEQGAKIVEYNIEKKNTFFKYFILQ